MRTRDEDEVVTLGCEGEGELFANAVRGTSYESPGAAGSECAELVGVRDIREESRMLGGAYRFTWQHKQAEKNSNSANDRCCERCNAYEQEAIDSSLHERVACVDVNTERLEYACHGEQIWEGPESGLVKLRSSCKRLQH